LSPRFNRLAVWARGACERRRAQMSGQGGRRALLVSAMPRGRAGRMRCAPSRMAFAWRVAGAGERVRYFSAQFAKAISQVGRLSNNSRFCCGRGGVGAGQRRRLCFKKTGRFFSFHREPTAIR
jgi:hypothetical protein